MKCYSRRALTIATGPASEPLTLSEAKLFLRLDDSDEDALVSRLITAARIAAEQYLRKSLITQQWKMTLEDFTGQVAALAMGPVQNVDSVTLIDEAQNESVIPMNSYRLGAQDILRFDVDQLSHRLEIVYTAGFGDAADVPAAIRQGMLAHLTRLYDLRGEGEGTPSDAIMLYAPFRELSL